MAISPNELSAFKRDILEIADTFSVLKNCKYGQVTPTETCEDLHKLDKTLTKALKVLLSLDLCHEQGQDVESNPYNYPLVIELAHSRSIKETMRMKEPYDVGSEDPAYPTNLIEGLIGLRNASRAAYEQLKPKRGNSSTRDSGVAVKGYIAKNFVRRYRNRFGDFPPTTKEGASGLVELLEQAFERVGADNSGADHWLRKAVEEGRIATNQPRRNSVKSTKS